MKIISIVGRKGVGIRLILSLAFISVVLFFIIGCETDVDEDWTGFGSTAHFPSPFENDHAGFLRAELFPLDGCQECHGADYTGGSSGVSCLECHIYSNGPQACNTCHGNFAGDPSDPLEQAPPADVSGDTSTTLISVGAHASHLTGVQYTDGIDCHNCHELPSAWNSSGHIDSIIHAEIVFSELAEAGDADPEWHRSSATCSNTYCHGDATPQWTIVNGSQADCETCHAIPPSEPSEYHSWPSLQQCYYCHPSVIDNQGEIIGKDLHLNGEIDTDF